MKRNANFLVSTVLGFLLLSSAVFAQGIVIPRHCPPPMPMPIPPRPTPLPPCDDWHTPLPIKSISITTTIDNQAAKTKVEQVFVNDTNVQLEGTYYFPIPETAALQEFAMYDGDKRIVGEVIEREKARRTYFEILRKLRDPGLLEYVGKNLFQARVFPIAPKSEKKIEIIYSQILRAEGGVVKYEYPLGVGHNALVRPIQSLAGKITIRSNVDIKNVYSPTHAVSVSPMLMKHPSETTVSFETAHVKELQDFILYYTLTDRAFGLTLLTHREKGKDGYFLLLLSPKSEIKESETLAKDVVFVLDTSGSMSDEGKITKAREALKFGIRSLGKSDRFNVINFSTEEHLFETGLVPATPGFVDRAVEYVDKLKANGGTDINSALLAALKSFSAGGAGAGQRPGYLVFMTDGLPTVGEQNIKKILENVREANQQNVRLFTFGFGYDVNTHLLDQLANNHHGAPEYVAPKEDLELRVSNFFAKVNYPVLADLKLDWGGLITYDVYPKALPDLFKGSQMVMLGRYSNEGGFPITLSGKYENRARTFSFGPQKWALESIDHDFIPRLWAMRKVGYLLDQIRLNGETKELKDAVIELATRFGIVTPYTSYLITEQDVMQPRVGGVPGGTLGGVLGGIQARTPSTPPPAPAAQTVQVGEQAVTYSDTLQQMKTVQTIAASGTSQMKHVRGKTFVLREGVWVDTEISVEKKWPVVKLTFGSEEFFKLVTANAELAEYLSIGNNVTVAYQGKVYEVRAKN